jgi:lysozyme family protein
MTTTAKIIEGILQREDGFVNDPADKGGRTDMGISEAANSAAWADGKVTKDEAYAIYTAKYVKFPRLDTIPDESLRIQLIDFGVVSGPLVAIMKLQAILKVTEDGVVGPETLGALAKADSKWVNNELVKARVMMIGKILQKHPDQLRFALGWLSRALEFLV